MTIPKVSITCDRFADKLSDYLERDVDEPTRAGMDAHAAECAECGALLTDLRSLRLGAANLPELVPSRDLWTGIAERIETPVVEITPMRAQQLDGPAWRHSSVACASGPASPRRDWSPSPPRSRTS